MTPRSLIWRQILEAVIQHVHDDAARARIMRLVAEYEDAIRDEETQSCIAAGLLPGRRAS
jgi:hypothetical protein